MPVGTGWIQANKAHVQRIYDSEVNPVFVKLMEIRWVNKQPRAFFDHDS